MANAVAVPNQTRAMREWTNTQAYLMAAFCLVLGVTLGFLFRGSAPDVQASAAAFSSSTQNVEAGQPTAEQERAMLDRAVAPLQAELAKNPDNFDNIVQLANLYYDGKQYPEAIQYYQRALRIHADNADVRTDLGTAYWYTGDAEHALIEFAESLKVNPNHAGTLFNIGMVRWQGKNDPAGAVAAWQDLLKRNPNYQGKQQVEALIAKARDHAKK